MTEGIFWQTKDGPDQKIHQCGQYLIKSCFNFDIKLWKWPYSEQVEFKKKLRPQQNSKVIPSFWNSGYEGMLQKAPVLGYPLAPKLPSVLKPLE